MTKLPLTLEVNGETVSAMVEPRTHLADFLREQLRLTSVHLGCEHGVCGACTVLIDGEPARSCVSLAIANDGASVQTLDGLAASPLIEKLKKAFHEEHGLQCGFCTPGMLIAAHDLLGRREALDAPAIREALAGNLCRCTGYQGIVRAILAAQAEEEPADTTETPARRLLREEVR